MNRTVSDFIVNKLLKLDLPQHRKNNLFSVGPSRNLLSMPGREFSDILPNPCAKVQRREKKSVPDPGRVAKHKNRLVKRL